MSTQGLQLAVEEQGFISLMWFYMVGGISRDFLAPVTIAIAIGMPAQLPLAHTLPALGPIQVVPLLATCHRLPRKEYVAGLNDLLKSTVRCPLRVHFYQIFNKRVSERCRFALFRN